MAHSDKSEGLTKSGNLWEVFLKSNLAGSIKLKAESYIIRKERNRLQISDGTTKVSPIVQISQTYAREAFIPKVPWRMPTNEESDALWLKETTENYEPYIGVVSIDDKVLEPLRDYLRGLNQSIGIFIVNQAIGTKLSQPLVTFLRRRFKIWQEPIIHGISVDKPGLITVTFNQDEGRFLGLHLDSWDKLAFSQRHKSLYRISVNIGWTERYLLCINLSLSGMAEILRQSNELCQPLVANSIGPKFMTKFPNYPVIKILIGPGEAYIAPTDNMIHDASTTDVNTVGFTFIIRGKFKM
jgi:hypothetical protein